MITATAWVVAVASFIAFLIALQVGPSCANTAGPWCAAAFFGAWLWLFSRYEGKNRR